MTEWGPLQALIGEWEAEGGLDTACTRTPGRRCSRRRTSRS